MDSGGTAASKLEAVVTRIEFYRNRYLVLVVLIPQ